MVWISVWYFTPLSAIWWLALLVEETGLLGENL